MKLGYLLICVLTMGFGTASFAFEGCDSQTLFTSISGRELIDCRIEGPRARALYESLDGREQSLTDDDGGPAGFSKEDANTYCYASAHKTSFECRQVLDSKSGQILPLNATVEQTQRVSSPTLSCALTDGQDVCSDVRPCCNPNDVCVIAPRATTGFCD